MEYINADHLKSNAWRAALETLVFIFLHAQVYTTMALETWAHITRESTILVTSIKAM